MNLLAKLVQLSGGLASRWRNLYFRALGVRIDGYVWMRKIEIPQNHGDIELAKGVSLDRGVIILCTGAPTGKPRVRIGARTYINRGTMLDATELLEIGSDCAIGPNCYLTDHDHGLDPSLPPLAQPLVCRPTRLGREVWLGAQVIVLKGVTIGDRAVIGAGSVVTKDIPTNAVAFGRPAIVVRDRSDSSNGKSPQPK